MKARIQIMNEIERKEVREAIDAADDALYHLKEARSYLSSASNWGLFDLLGGGAISGLLKHSKMGKAEAEVNAAKASLDRFSRELHDVRGYSSIHIDGLLTFGDFFFDGFLMDVIVQSKINDAKKQCDKTIKQVENIKKELEARM